MKNEGWVPMVGAILMELVVRSLWLCPLLPLALPTLDTPGGASVGWTHGVKLHMWRCGERVRGFLKICSNKR